MVRRRKQCPVQGNFCNAVYRRTKGGVRGGVRGALSERQGTVCQALCNHMNEAFLELGKSLNVCSKSLGIHHVCRYEGVYRREKHGSCSL